MTPDKQPKDRRQNKEERLRYAIRKANDRMFSHLERRPEPDESKPQDRQPH